MNEQHVSRVTYVFIAAAFLFLLFFFLRAGVERVLTVIPDDAAYYFTIAENASAGEGLTFDRINRTNGFPAAVTRRARSRLPCVSRCTSSCDSDRRGVRPGTARTTGPR